MGSSETRTAHFFLLVPALILFCLPGFFRLLSAKPCFLLFLKKVILREKTGINWKLNLKGHVKYYLLAMYLPVATAIVGGILYFLVFPSHLDLQMTGVLASIPPEILAEAGGEENLKTAVYAQIFVAALLGWLPNIPITLGEEAGWRGFLYPELQKKFGTGKAMLLGGMIWGLWHLPLTVQGHNYGLHYRGFPVVGIGMMCLFCISTGVCLMWVSHKSGSIWPAVFCHSAMNAFNPAPLMMTYPEFQTSWHMLLGPVNCGLLSMIPVLVLAFLAAKDLLKER